MVAADAEGVRVQAARVAALVAVADVSSADGRRRHATLLHRFATSTAALADAMVEWLSIGQRTADLAVFQPSLQLFGGWLPGSAQVSATASAEGGFHILDRVRLAPYTRMAIQMGVAVGLAIALGDVVSGRRYYWAVIAVFVTFMGVNNSAEQTRKAVYRVIGTVVGIGIGSLLVDVVGHDPYWSIAVILASLFFGLYLMRTSYAFFVVGVTVMVSQLYVQLGEFSNSLLFLRLAETALGAVVAVVVVLVVLPLRTRNVLRVSLREYVQAVGQLTDNAGRRLLGNEGDGGGSLRADARTVDATYQTVMATGQPLRRNLAGRTDDGVIQSLSIVSASRHYSRSLVTDLAAVGCLDHESRWVAEHALCVLHDSLDAVATGLCEGAVVPYTRSSALFDQAERQLEQSCWVTEKNQLAFRDFRLIDGTMAQLAVSIGMIVTDYDTVGPADPLYGSS
jgi:uncharacterized membrane protein YccC